MLPAIFQVSASSSLQSFVFFLSSPKAEESEIGSHRKMQIKIKCNCGETKCLEWAVVELQGVVEAQPSFQDRLQNLEIGILCRPSAQEVYTFTVGYHELRGSKVPLKKPLLVLKKNRCVDEDHGSDTAELEVIGIIRQRILFKTRPKALISKPQPLAKERSRASGSAVTGQTT